MKTKATIKKEVKLVRITVIRKGGESIIEFIRPDKIYELYKEEPIIADIIDKI